MELTGTCTGVVVNTGDHTVMGRIARLAGSIVEESKIEPYYSPPCVHPWSMCSWNAITLCVPLMIISLNMGKYTPQNVLINFF